MASRTKSKYVGFIQDGYKVVDRAYIRKGRMDYRIVNKDLELDFWVSGSAMRKVALKKTTLAKIYYYKTNYRKGNQNETSNK